MAFLVNLILALLCSQVARAAKCYEGAQLAGPTINEDNPTLMGTAYDCQYLCQINEECLFWNWVSPDYAGSYHIPLTCWLISDNPVLLVQQGFVGGDQYCELP